MHIYFACVCENWKYSLCGHKNLNRYKGASEHSTVCCMVKIVVRETTAAMIRRTNRCRYRMRFSRRTWQRAQSRGSMAPSCACPCVCMWFMGLLRKMEFYHLGSVSNDTLLPTACSPLSEGFFWSKKGCRRWVIWNTAIEAALSVTHWYGRFSHWLQKKKKLFAFTFESFAKATQPVYMLL